MLHGSLSSGGRLGETNRHSNVHYQTRWLSAPVFLLLLTRPTIPVVRVVVPDMRNSINNDIGSPDFALSEIWHEAGYSRAAMEQRRALA